MTPKVTRKSTATPRKSGSSSPHDVATFLDALDHPSKPEFVALRQIILGADPTITEGIKWNAPSFRTSEWFATFHLRAKDGVQIILHLGAKVRDIPARGLAIADPDSLLKWLAKDRATVTFRDSKEIEAKRAAFAKLIRAWIGYV